MSAHLGGESLVPLSVDFVRETKIKCQSKYATFNLSQTYSSNVFYNTDDHGTKTAIGEIVYPPDYGQYLLKIYSRGDWCVLFQDGSIQESTMRCFGCFSSEFKSAVADALDEKASPDPRVWMPDVCARKDVDIATTVDVLICRNDSCKQYHCVKYEEGDGHNHGGFRLCFVDLGFSVDDVAKRKDAIVSLLSSADRHKNLPRVLCNLIVDYIHCEPGKFPPCSSSEYQSSGESSYDFREMVQLGLESRDMDFFGDNSGKCHLDGNGHVEFMIPENEMRLVESFGCGAYVLGYAYHYGTSHRFDVDIFNLAIN